MTASTTSGPKPLSDFAIAKRSQELSLAVTTRDDTRQGRATPTRIDPSFGWSEAIRRAEQIIDADRELIDFIDGQIASTRKIAGRPVEFSTRSYLICAIAYALKGDGDFHLRDLHLAMLDFPTRDRIRLGIARSKHGRPAPLTYAHVRGAHHRIARAFDAESDVLTAETRSDRFDKRQHIIGRILQATMPEDPYAGGYAIDGTFIPSFYTPARRYRRERAKANGTRTDRHLEATLHDEGAIWYSSENDRPLRPQPRNPTEVAAARRDVKEKDRHFDIYLCFPSHDADAGWHVRDNKSRWGYNAVTAIRSTPGSPMLVEHFTVSAGSGSEDHHGRRVIDDLRNLREADPAVSAITEGKPILGYLCADMGFTQYLEFWLAATRAGGVVIADLKTYQRTPTSIEFANGDTAVNIEGHTFCACMPAELRQLGPPDAHDRAKVAEYREAINQREPFRYKPNALAPTRKNGGWPHRTPHHAQHTDGQHGGCDHCVNPDGSAVHDQDGRPRQRCCTQRIHQLRPDDYKWRQPEVYGTEAWKTLFSRRNLPEAHNAAIKEQHSRIGTKGAIRLRHLVNFTLVTLFYAVATNINMLRNWETRQDRPTESADHPAAARRKTRGKTSRPRRAEPSRARPPARSSPPDTGPPQRSPAGFGDIYS